MSNLRNGTKITKYVSVKTITINAWTVTVCIYYEYRKDMCGMNH